MQPKVTISPLDNQLGILPPQGGEIMAIAGVAETGTFNVPQSFTRVKDLQSSFTRGPLVEMGAYALEFYGKPIVAVRTSQSVAGSYGTVTQSGQGTATVTPDVTTTASDEYEIFVKFLTGGTIGVAGITYQESLDGGRTMSATKALGTANNMVFADSGGAEVDFGAGTILANQTFAFRANPKKWNDTELSTALTALKDTALPWNFVQIFGALTDTAITTVAANLATMEGVGKYRWAIGNARSPNEGESESSYLTAMTTLYAAASNRRISLGGAYCKTDSSVSRRRYRRPVSLSVAALASAVGPHIDLAEIGAAGALPGVRIRDANGNRDEHDESIDPGLDDIRMLTLRTHEGYEGVFVNNPRLISPTGSDFLWIQYRRVMDIACRVVRTKLQLRLSKEIKLDKVTGFILEADALEIESGINVALRDALVSPGFVSAANFVLSRTDNVLSTLTLNGQARVIPLGYPKFINVDIGLFNPALLIAA